MRRGLTLIELIFSMVIIAIVFTVVPKIIFASNKSLQLGIKEDALFNAVTLIGSIAKLPWDENTIVSNGGILDAGGVTCNDYRQGGFEGSRNCLDNDGSSTWDVSPTMGREGSVYNDVDDYHNNIQVTSGGRIDYNLSTTVVHNGDIKRIKVTVSTSDKRLGNSFQSSFFYDSANLGHIQINKRTW
jgi:prepilin-type N-terminal cleavage/methylation domain-containing protein